MTDKIEEKERVDVWEWYYHEGCLYATDYAGRELQTGPVINRSDITMLAETATTIYNLRGPAGVRPRWYHLNW